MSIIEIAIIVYSIIGALFSYYWYDDEYSKEYELLEKNDEGAEKGMVSLLLLFMAAFWPLKLLLRLIKKKKI